MFYRVELLVQRSRLISTWTSSKDDEVVRTISCGHRSVV